jgi:hypothetical protein
MSASCGREIVGGDDRDNFMTVVAPGPRPRSASKGRRSRLRVAAEQICGLPMTGNLPDISIFSVQLSSSRRTCRTCCLPDEFIKRSNVKLNVTFSAAGRLGLFVAGRASRMPLTALVQSSALRSARKRRRSSLNPRRDRGPNHRAASRQERIAERARGGKSHDGLRKICHFRFARRPAGYVGRRYRSRRC